MSIQTYTIEMKVDISEDAHSAFTDIMKQYARDWLSSATILSPHRPPMVICKTTDAFYNATEIGMMDIVGLVRAPGDQAEGA